MRETLRRRLCVGHIAYRLESAGHWHPWLFEAAQWAKQAPVRERLDYVRCVMARV